MKWAWPAAFALAVSALYVFLRLASHGWDPAALAEPGSRYQNGVVGGTEGYDGQFALSMALDLNPNTVASHLDVPAYRYQRILYPLLARWLVIGQPQAIPWSLLVVNLLAHTAGTLVVCSLLRSYGQPPHYALAYAAWVGLVAAVGLDLHEPLAFALVAAAWLARRSHRPWLSAILIAVSLFAKETGLIFWAAWLAHDLLSAGAQRNAWKLVAAAVPFAAWQLWLAWTFGSPGLASGGAMATGFEIVPFGGLWRIAQVDTRVFLLYLAILGPSVVLPAVWGLLAAGSRLRLGADSTESVTLFLQAGAMAFIPFSTFREPLGILRVATGMVLAVLVFAARYNLRRPLVYSLGWPGLLAVLLRG